MSVLFMDSCKSYNNFASISDKWTYVYTRYGNSVYGRSSDLRTGAYENFLDTGSDTSIYNDRIYVTIPENTTIYVGIVIKKTLSTVNSIVEFMYGSSIQVAFVMESDGTLNARRGSKTGTILASSSSGTITTGHGYQHFEFMVTVDATAGAVSVEIDGENALSEINLDTENVSGGINRIQIRGPVVFTDFYIDNSQGHGACQVDGLLPDADGNYSQMTPVGQTNNYECVDDRGDNDDTDYVNADAVNEIDTYSVETLSSITGSTIKAVAVNNVSRKTDVDTVKIKPIIRANSSDYLGSEETISVDYLNYQQIWETNPDDSAAWELADINGAEFGLKRTV